jgi:hypothetical protein
MSGVETNALGHPKKRRFGLNRMAFDPDTGRAGLNSESALVRFSGVSRFPGLSRFPGPTRSGSTKIKAIGLPNFFHYTVVAGAF